MAKPSKAAPKDPGLVVTIRDWVLVRMPPEEGKPTDRYAVVEVEAKVHVGDGRVIVDKLPRAYALKEASIAITRDGEKRLRAVPVFG